jgi:hypothetical protein
MMNLTQNLDIVNEDDNMISEHSINEHAAEELSNANNSKALNFNYSITPHLKEMRASIKDTKYAIAEVAVMGKHTLLVAKGSVGKSLIALKGVCEQINSGEILGKNVIYMTGDGGYEDVVLKAEQIESYGIGHVFVDGLHDFTMRKDFYNIMSKLIKDESASGVILIVDVLRNVADPMDKRDMQNYNESVNKLLLAGGTVITCVHANKHLGNDGMPIIEGVSDVRDGCDCTFLLTKTVEGKQAYITLNRDKAKCVVSKAVRYTYPESAKSYQELFDNTKYISEQAAEKIQQQATAKVEAANISIQKVLNKKYIDKACEIIRECEADDSNTRTNIRDKLSDATDLSRIKAEAILDTYTGDSWKCDETGRNNAKTYSVIKAIKKLDFNNLKLDLPYEEDSIHPM